MCGQRHVVHRGGIAMRSSLFFAIGLGIGTATYQAIRYGVEDIGWTRVVFIFVVGLVVALLVPRRFFERSEPAHR
jgi:hypothetical protein